MPTCPVKNCHAKHLKSSNSKKVTFHRLPKNQKRRKEWISNLKLDEKRITGNTLICSQHFSKEMFDYTSLSCIRLRENAVPKIVETVSTTVTEKYLNSEGIHTSDSPLKQLLVAENLNHKELDVSSFEQGSKASCSKYVSQEKYTNWEKSNLHTRNAETQTTVNLCDKETSMSPNRINSSTKKYMRQALVQQRKQYQSKIKILQQNARQTEARIVHLQNVIQELHSERFTL